MVFLLFFADVFQERSLWFFRYFLLTSFQERSVMFCSVECVQKELFKFVKVHFNDWSKQVEVQIFLFSF